jgi:hypothetical protein
MVDLTDEQVRELVRGFWREVDGGWCDSCSGQAVAVCERVLPEHDWQRIFTEVRNEDAW